MVRVCSLLAIILTFVLGMPSAVADLPPEKTARVVTLDQGLGPVLSGIADNVEQKRDSQARNIALTLANGKTVDGEVLVPVIVSRPEVGNLLETKAKQLKSNGLKVDAQSRSFVRILSPINKLRTLETLLPNVRLRAPYPKDVSSGYGDIVSESVNLTGANFYQTNEFTGQGVKVAVVDLGFDDIQATIAAGELPSDIIAVNGDTPVSLSNLDSISGSQNHGTLVAQHVIDMAPDVELYCIYIQDSVDLENAKDYIASQGIDIVNLSVAWVLTSYYDGTGVINDIVNDSNNLDGKFWAVSSGNYAQKHWRGGWLDANSDGYHDFDGSGEMALTSGGSNVAIYLNWNQYGASKKTDFDLFIIDSSGATVAASTIRQNRFQEPYELISQGLGGTAPYSIKIQHAGGSISGIDLTLFSFNNNLEFAMSASSMGDPATAPGAFTVGAIRKTVWDNASPYLESFSSRGPTNDGRQGINIVGPDGTQCLAYDGSNNPSTQSAFGTSFSSPTTAGAAAILLSESPSMTNSDLKSALENLANDVGSVGSDNDFGVGQLSLTIDSDSDGIPDGSDNCPGVANPDQLDSDGDLIGDVCDGDRDGDGVDNGPDNCPDVSNADQSDIDGDGAGDSCDADMDGDGLTNAQESSLGTYMDNPDSDGDGLLDGEEVNNTGTIPTDPDSDNDNLTDGEEVLTYGTDPNNSNLGDLAPRGTTDGELNAGDLVVLSRIVFEQITPTTLESIIADINQDGDLNVVDFMLLQQAVINDTPL